MKIIHVLPSLANAGAEKLVLSHISNLFDLGHLNIVISFYNIENSYIFNELRRKGIEVLFLNKKKGFDFSLFFKLGSIFKLAKPDVIHTHLRTLLYCLPSYLLNNKAIKVHTIHSLPKNEGGIIHFFLYKYFFKNRYIIPVALSKINQELIIKYYKLNYFPPIVFNGIHRDLISPKTRFKIGKIINFVHVGRFSKEKNHYFLIEIFELIFSKFPNSMLHLYGEGPLLEEIKNIVSTKRISSSVFFHGLVDNASEILNNYDIFLLTSKWEGFPLVVVEALANGLPVLTTNAGGVSEIVKSNYNGYICLNKEDFLNKVVSLISSKNLYSKLSKMAISSTLLFNSIDMTKNYLSLYEKNLKLF
jgi:glycosyltransferase involved in cell wall biosynthesis